MPDGNGIDLLTLVKQRTAAHRGHRDDRARRARDRHRGDEARRLRLRHEAVRDQRAARAGPQGAREARHRRRERAPPGAARSASTGRELLGHSEAMRRIFDLVAAHRPRPHDRAHHGRERHRQGAHRARHPRGERPPRQARSSSSTAAPSPRRSSRRSSSATSKGAFTGAVAEPPRASSARPTAARSSSTRSASCRSALQVKLLRVLQERKVRSVGASAEVPVDVRVLAATNRNVEDEVKAGRFRQDLYYRLNVIRIEVPPLRERREDIRPLAEHFLARCARSRTRTSAASRRDALRALEAYAFPGNVRELENIVERAVALATGPTHRPRRPARARSSGAAAQPTPGARRPARGGLQPRRRARRGRAAPRSCRRSSGPAACARRPRSCSASPCAASATACRSTRLGDESDDEGEPNSESRIETPR